MSDFRSGRAQPFESQFAVVTGATRGIGNAIALALAEEGSRVCLVGRDASALDAIAASARARSLHAHSFRVDLTNDGEIEALAAQVQRELGRVDLLVNSHGSYARGPTASFPVEDLDLLYRANVRSAYVLTQSLLGLLKVSRGQIVFVNSSIVGSSQADLGAYAATQQALRAIAESLRQEVNSDGIRVLTVYPGRTATPRQARIHATEGKPYQPERLIQPEDVAFMVIGALKVARSVEVTDIHSRPMFKPA